MISKKNKVILFTSIIALLLNSTIQVINAQSDQNTEDQDQIVMISETILDQDDNLILAGIAQSGKAAITKISQDGEVMWEDRFGGGTDTLDYIDQIEIDQENNLIVAGITETPEFPTTENAMQPNHGGDFDLFVRKWDSEGKLLFSTLIGGSNQEFVGAVYDILRIDSNNNIIINGYSASTDFEVSENAFQRNNKGGVSSFSSFNNGDLLIVKLSPDGVLRWSTFLGSSGAGGAVVQLDGDDNIIVGGRVLADDFSVFNAYQPTFAGGNSDGFITKFAPDGGIVFSTYLGGDGWDGTTLITIDKENNLIANTGTASSVFWNIDIPDDASGVTADIMLTKFDPLGNPLWSTYGDFDLVGGTSPLDITDDLTKTGIPIKYQLNSVNDYVLYTNTNTDQFVTKNAIQNQTADSLTDLWGEPVLLKYDVDGNLTFSTYIGGSAIDFTGDLLIDTSDDIYLTGTTFSSDFIEKNNVFQSGLGGLDDIFIKKVSTEGELLWSTFLGGSERERFRTAYLDQDENLVIVGETDSENFPLYQPLQEEFGGETDIFITKISGDGELLWSTYLGGEGVESVNKRSILVDSNNQIYVTSVSDSSNLPNLSNPTKTNEFAFVQKLDPSGQPVWINGLVDPIEEEEDDSETFLIVTIIVLSSLAFLVSGNVLRIRHSNKVVLNQRMSEILSPIFQSKPSLIYLFIGQSMIKDKGLENNLRSEIPKEIFDFKEIFHPVRLSILKLLYENTQMTSIEIKETLDLSWNDVKSNLNVLQKKDYLHIEQQFVEGLMRMVVTPKPKALSQFQKLSELLEVFIHRTPDLTKYLDHVINVTSKGTSEEMYPSN